MTDESDPGERVAAVYDAAADNFDHPALSFWDRFGAATVARAEIEPGAKVLDVCCGSGASAIPAARQSGETGRVIAVDLAERLLRLGRAKCRRLGLTNIEFRKENLERLNLPAASFDAVICVFGIFFLADMTAGVRHLWRFVKPGGRLAVTTWGTGVFAPAEGWFWEAVRAQRPDLHKAFNAWDRIGEPAALRQLMHEGGAIDAVIEREENRHELRAYEDWWTIVMGTGYRATIDAMDETAREAVRSYCLRQLEAHEVRSLQTSVVYGVAIKAG